MSVYPNVTEQDMINLAESPEQRKNQRAKKTENRFLKQTHDVKLAESLFPLTKILEMVDKSAEKLRKGFKKSASQNEINQELDPVEINVDNSEDGNDIIRSHVRAPPKCSIFIDQLTKTIGALMTSSNSLSIKSTPSGASINWVLIYTMASNTIQIDDIVYEWTDEIYKSLSPTGYTCKSMKKDSDFLLSNIKIEIRYTGVGDRTSKRKTSSSRVCLKSAGKPFGLDGE